MLLTTGDIKMKEKSYRSHRTLTFKILLLDIFKYFRLMIGRLKYKNS